MCDFQEHTHKQITLEEINYTDDIFLDFVHNQYRETTDAMISFSMDNNTLYLQYKGDSHEIPVRELRIPSTMTVAPEYFIEPTMN